MIETERLTIKPASQEVMEEFIRSQINDELKAAYTEMLNGCLSHPEQWEWYAIWVIALKDGTHIGDLCFKGLNADGVSEIGYGILPQYQGKGYATEAVTAVLKWVFEHPEVTAIEAEAAPDNIASIRVLTKCGFIPTGTIGEEGPRYAIKKCGIEMKDISFKVRIADCIDKLDSI